MGDGEGDGREVQKGGDICIPMADSDFPGGSDGKASVHNAGDPDLSPGLGRSLGEGSGQSTPVLLPGKSHEQKSLVGYSPWGH